MLQDNNSFSSFSVHDKEAARKFYMEVLGITVKDHPMGILELHVAGNVPIVMYPKDNHSAAEFTVLNFPVKNIEKTADELIGKGVTFEQYPDMKTDEKGISRNEHGPAIAWFKDPSGNILSIIEAE